MRWTFFIAAVGFVPSVLGTPDHGDVQNTETHTTKTIWTTPYVTTIDSDGPTTTIISTTYITRTLVRVDPAEYSLIPTSARSSIMFSSSYSNSTSTATSHATETGVVTCSSCPGGNSTSTASTHIESVVESAPSSIASIRPNVLTGVESSSTPVWHGSFGWNASSEVAPMCSSSHCTGTAALESVASTGPPAVHTGYAAPTSSSTSASSIRTSPTSAVSANGPVSDSTAYITKTLTAPCTNCSGGSYTTEAIFAVTTAVCAGCQGPSVTSAVTTNVQTRSQVQDAARNTASPSQNGVFTVAADDFEHTAEPASTTMKTLIVSCTSCPRGSYTTVVVSTVTATFCSGCGAPRFTDITTTNEDTDAQVHSGADSTDGPSTMNPSIVEHTAGPASPAKSQVQSGAANTAAALHVESYTTNRGNVAPSAKTGSPSETQVQSGADNTSAQSQATLSAINPSNAEQAAETAGPSKTQPSDETASSSSSDEALAPSTEAYQGAAAGLALSVPEVAVIMALAMLCGLVPAL